MKLCKRCHIKKKSSEFGIDKRYDTLNSYCKKCVREYLKEYYLKVRKPIEHPDKEKRPVKQNHRWCLKCGIEKPVTSFYKGNTCKECANAQSKVNYAKNIDHIKKRSKKYREDNLQHIKAKSAIYRKQINHSAYSNGKNKQYRKQLTDSYIRIRMRGKGIKNSSITKEMIEQWRGLILIERIKKQLELNGKKICSYCKAILPISEFLIKKFKWKGQVKNSRDNFCRKCANKRHESYKKKNEVQKSS